jgi:hypothetical protein
MCASQLNAVFDGPVPESRMVGVSDSLNGGQLPRCLRRAFWCVVALEWAAAFALSAVCGVGVYWGLQYVNCADADTLYSQGYSDSAWLSVKPGDMEATVRHRLGEPLQRWAEPGGQLWSYSSHGTTSDDYLERKLRFDLLGRVVEKHEECYLD